MELRKLSGVNSATVSLNRKVLFANKFIHSLVREKILALQKARTSHSTAERCEIPQEMGANKPGSAVWEAVPYRAEFANGRCRLSRM
jgi:hypothetical protein